MKRDEYYALLKERWEQVDKTSREAIHEYNEWRRALRQELEMESPGTPFTPPLQKGYGEQAQHR